MEIQLHPGRERNSQMFLSFRGTESSSVWVKLLFFFCLWVVGARSEIGLGSCVLVKTLCVVES